MKYVCVGYHCEQAWKELSEDQRQSLIDASLSYEAVLRRSGHVVDAHGLQSATTATTLRFKDGQMTVTDGPFAETKEQIGGFMVLEANDLNHAIQLMSQIPCMRIGGSLEIRPLNEALATTTTPPKAIRLAVSI